MPAPRERETHAGVDLRLLRAAVFAAVCVALSAAGHGLASGAPVPPWTLGAAFLTMLVVVVPLAGRPRSLAGIAALLAAGQIVLHMLFGLGQHGMTMHQAGADTELVARAARLLCGAGAATISPVEAQRILTAAGVGPGTAHHVGGTGHGMDMGTGMSAGQPMHHHALDALTGPATGPVVPFTHLSLPMLPSLPMLLGHVLAGAAAGWLLRRGDLALFRLVALSAYGIAELALVRALRAAFALVCALHAGLLGVQAPRARLPRTAPLATAVPAGTVLEHSVIRRGPPSVLVLAA